jgi:glucosamine 6-phosphate synthetase-like amidotransferase/phosphosugar isomerase protein
MLIGSYNLAILHLSEPNAIYLVKNSGDMAIGHNKDTNQYIISSDSEILKDEFGITDIIMLKDNEIVKVEPDNITR